MNLEVLTEMFSKDNLRACRSHLWVFFKKFYVTAFFYCLYGGLAYIAAVLFPALLKSIGATLNCCSVVMKILYSIAPALSVLGLSRHKNDDKHNEISMELGFAGWLVTVLWAWKFL